MEVRVVSDGCEDDGRDNEGCAVENAFARRHDAITGQDGIGIRFAHVRLGRPEIMHDIIARTNIGPSGCKACRERLRDMRANLGLVARRIGGGAGRNRFRHRIGST